MAKMGAHGWGPRQRIDKRTDKAYWVVDYKDAGGKRHQLRCATQKEATARWQTIQEELSRGKHVAPNQSVTLNQAAEDYYETLTLEDAARGTIDGRRYTYKNHIGPFLGALLVSSLTGPMVRRHLLDCLKRGLSKDRVKTIKTTLSAILSEAVERGTAAFNAAAAMRRKRTRRAAVREKEELQCEVLEKFIVEKLIKIAGQLGWYMMAIRHDGGLAGKSGKQVSYEINTSMEAVDVVRIDADNRMGSRPYENALAELRRRWKCERNVVFRAYYIGDWIQTFIIVMAFTGLRVGEMRALRWNDVNWAGKLHVRQAADQYRKIGPVKSPAALRDVPTGDIAIGALRELWERRGRPKTGLVFPGRNGGLQSRETIAYRHFAPIWFVLNQRDAEGALVYRSFHSLRHFCVSLWIQQGADIKKVQKWIGHERIETTIDIYGHLFDEREAAREMVSKAERSVLGDAFQVPAGLEPIQP